MQARPKELPGAVISVKVYPLSKHCLNGFLAEDLRHDDNKWGVPKSLLPIVRFAGQVEEYAWRLRDPTARSVLLPPPMSNEDAHAFSLPPPRTTFVHADYQSALREMIRPAWQGMFRCQVCCNHGSA